MNKKAEILPSIVLGIVAIVAISGFVVASFNETRAPITGEAVSKGKYKGCATIQKDELYTTDGELITTGYSEWGYNYQVCLMGCIVITLQCTGLVVHSMIGVKLTMEVIGY